MNQTAVVEPIPWPAESAEKVLRKLVQRKISYFANYPDVDEDDLFQEVYSHAHAEFWRYRPDRGHWSTFVYTVGWRRIIRILGKRTKDVAKTFASAIEEYAESEEDAGLPGSEGDRGSQTLAEWAGMVYCHAKRVFPPRLGPGRASRYPQVVTVVLLQRKLGLSTRQTVRLFQNDRDLCAELGFNEPPYQQWVQRAGKIAEGIGMKKRALREFCVR